MNNEQGGPRAKWGGGGEGRGEVHTAFGWET